ncbi:MAG TPA: class I SAM-dependent methyltransferase [Acidiferrobacteraceae bacterium]|nr:class I SAM-dependent methyltransferase [Acidiferrobacteraceae bacterium]HEX20387.1 class I SAM-dependent methyltransferase [Acidiferrobacteraceae bacterium]
MNDAHPKIVDSVADKKFCELASRLGFDPNNLWLNGYVDYEWEHGRHIFNRFAIRDKLVLEFGCNIAASSIVFAALGAKVVAIDVDPDKLEMAKLNVKRYGLDQNIEIRHIPDTRKLPFDTEKFDIVSCNSVLEYVRHDHIADVMTDLNRVTKVDGVMLITGTSSRLWPKEIHSRKWFTNYIPRFIDKYFLKGEGLWRGLFPWQLTSRLKNFENLDLSDNGKAYLGVKEKMGASRMKIGILKFFHRIFGMFGVTIGLMTPNISLIIRKIR